MSSTTTDLRRPDDFTETYRQYAPLAFAAANRVLRDPGAAEDVVQEIFLSLWRRPKTFDPERGSLAHYVTMIARSRALDHWRTRTARDGAVERSKHEAHVHAAAEESAVEQVITRERSRQAVSALRAVPDEQREVLLLAYGGGLSAREIAATTKIPLGTAKSRIRLGLAHARERVGAAA